MSRRRRRILRLRCPCNNNVADVVSATDRSGSIVVKHRAQLLSLPDAPSYEWRCRCGRTLRARRSRLVQAYMAVPAGPVVYRTIEVDL
jgi:hypothetical protein